jgi:molybdopterin molybdotransferase
MIFGAWRRSPASCGCRCERSAYALGTSPRRSPAGYDNSAVDGYAVRFDDLDPARPTTFRCIDRIAAGHDPAGPLAPGVAAHIFTGAILPDGADVVIMQEDCERDGEKVIIRPGIKRGANTRRAGEDVAPS